jgi:hypothetical protein
VLDVRGLTLVISDKPDSERDAVAAAWETGGGEVLRLARFWEPPPLDVERVRLYGAEAFCQVLAQKLGVALVTPADDLLLRLSSGHVKRTVRRTTVAESGSIAFPTFIKSFIPKLIRSRVYSSADDLADALRGAEPTTELLVSEIIDLDCEVRCWTLAGEVLSIACYEGDADLDEARELASIVTYDYGVPSPCVIDMGRTRDRGWVVIEANAAWGSGLNGCDPVAAARCIAGATKRSALDAEFDALVPAVPPMPQLRDWQDRWRAVGPSVAPRLVDLLEHGSEAEQYSAVGALRLFGYQVWADGYGADMVYELTEPGAHAPRVIKPKIAPFDPR